MMFHYASRYLLLAALLLINQSFAANYCSACNGQLRLVSYETVTCNAPIKCDQGEGHGTCTATKTVDSMVCKSCNTPSIIEECEQKETHKRGPCTAHPDTQPFWMGKFRGWDGQSD